MALGFTIEFLEQQLSRDDFGVDGAPRKIFHDVGVVVECNPCCAIVAIIAADCCESIGDTVCDVLVF